MTDSAGDMDAARLRLSIVTEDSSVRFGTSGARGLVTDLTPVVVQAYVQAFLTLFSTRPSLMLLGHDLRPSSPAIARICLGALESAGVAVQYSEAIPTPALACAAGRLEAPAIMVTGHIPFDRNGLKFFLSSGEITKCHEAAMAGAKVEPPANAPMADLPRPDPQAGKLYLRRYEERVPQGGLRGMRVGIYEHSSVARDFLHHLLDHAGAVTVSLGRTDDFIAIDTEAVRDEDVRLAGIWASEHRLDAIVSADGDGDRPMIADEEGRWLRGDTVGMLCAAALNARAVVTPVTSTTALEQSGLFETVIRTKIGSPYVIAAMDRAQSEGWNLVAGFEPNGGFIVGEGFRVGDGDLGSLPTRDAMLPILLVLLRARSMGVKISALDAQLPRRFTYSGRLENFATAKSLTLIAALAADDELARMLMCPDAGAIVLRDATDGFRLGFAAGEIVHLRSSGNAPELRCYAESQSTAQAQRLCSACLRRIAALP